MIQTLFQEKYPIYTLELGKKETSFQSVDEIIDYYRKKMEAHPVVVFLGVFDHYAHTLSIEGGVVGEGIKAAKNIMFCFGKELKNPGVMAVRPRSIGVVELDGSFVVTFLEAPNPAANETMEGWTKELAAR